jgi:DNA-binding FrmR family transcriptional regulator
MPSDVTREEFEGRVGVLEREVEGEKLVTRHILDQTRLNSADLAAIKTRLDRVEGKVDGLDQKIDGVESRLTDRIGSLERSMPKIVGDVMREVLRERGGKA